jgi:hypothetical protein
MSTKSILPMALAAGTLMLSAGASSAMPMVAKPQIDASAVQTVGWRCGPGWHVNGWGRCVPNRRVYVPIRPVVRAHHWHPGYWSHHRWHAGYWR